MKETGQDNIEEVVRRAKDGDNEAFAWLYESYFAPLYRYVYFRVGSKTDAEDLTQEVFVKGYVSFGKYSYSGTSPLAYFYTIARNAIIDFRRKKKILILDDDEMLDVPDAADSPLEVSAKGEESEMVRQKISLLPEDQQDAIVLRYIDGLPNKEISELLGKSEESVRQLQSRGIKTLRKHMS